MAFRRPGDLSRGDFGVSYSAKFRDAPPERHNSRPPPTSGSDRIQTGSSLPVAQYRKQLLYLVEKHATVIIVGETGCGKTTQIPQYLHEAGWTAQGYQVVCTQPRRMAAVSVASRVAEELGVRVGELVGYGVRFDEAASQGTTKIKFVTDGLLLREMMDDPLLTRYSVVMVDEAHERSLATDTLLGLLKKVQKRRPELRLIISSATLEVEKLRAFFDTSSSRGPAAAAAGAGGGGGNAPSRAPAVIAVKGRQHPVQVHYLLEPCSDYVKSAVNTVVELHREDVPGDVLLFLTGQAECEAAVALLEEEGRKLARSRLKYKLAPLALYAGLPGGRQQLVLFPTPRGSRKVVVATNIAETSLTIEGIVYVVDCCYVKQRAYNPLLGLEALLLGPTSQASAQQRAGRAGRVRPGHAFRLCTQEDFQELLPPATVPEMQRSGLADIMLQLKALGIDNIMKFDWLAPPPAEAVIRGLELLHALGALDEGARLTPGIGVPLASLPLDPCLGKCLLAAAGSCAQEFLTIAAMLSVPSIWSHAGAGGEKRALEEAQAKFAVAEGDLATYLNVYEAWVANGRSQKWAVKHCIHQHAMLHVEDIKQQLVIRSRHLGLTTSSSCQGDLDPVLRAAAAGMFMNAAYFDTTEYDPRLANDSGTHVYRLVRLAKTGHQPKLRIHARSVLARVQPAFVVFLRCQQNDEGWFQMQDVTAIDPQWLVEVAPGVFERQVR